MFYILTAVSQFEFFRELQLPKAKTRNDLVANENPSPDRYLKDRTSALRTSETGDKLIATPHLGS